MLKTLLTLFAKPLGNAINNAIAAGAGAVIAYGTAKGVSTDISVPVVGAFVLALSTLISGFAATQGVQIPIINADQTNGVRVVDSSKADMAGLPAAIGTNPDPNPLPKNVG